MVWGPFQVPLTLGLVARLTFAGGACAAITRAVTSPIDLEKTRAQLADKSPPPHEQQEQQEQELQPPPPPPPQQQQPVTSRWLGVDTSFATGFALGAGSFGTYEFLKRTLPQVVGGHIS